MYRELYVTVKAEFRVLPTKSSDPGNFCSLHRRWPYSLHPKTGLSWHIVNRRTKICLIIAKLPDRVVLFRGSCCSLGVLDLASEHVIIHMTIHCSTSLWICQLPWTLQLLSLPWWFMWINATSDLLELWCCLDSDQPILVPDLNNSSLLQYYRDWGAYCVTLTFVLGISLSEVHQSVIIH